MKNLLIVSLLVFLLGATAGFSVEHYRPKSFTFGTASAEYGDFGLMAKNGAGQSCWIYYTPRAIEEVAWRYNLKHPLFPKDFQERNADLQSNGVMFKHITSTPPDNLDFQIVLSSKQVKQLKQACTK